MMHIQQWYALHDAFKPEEIDQMQALTDNLSVEEADVIRGGVSFRNLLSRNCKSGWLFEEPENEWLFARITDLIARVNDRTFRFEIDHIEPLQYLEYGFGQFYNKHVDNGDDEVATRKLTMIIQLSDKSEYLGGRTSIDSMAKSRHAPRERGSVAIFPSHLPHKAHPVWYGKRKALVAWARGKRPLS